MSADDWSRTEVEAIVDDYLSMLAAELAGTPYNKAAHRRSLLPRLNGRSQQSIEFKHANISAALLAAGFPYIDGYKPRLRYEKTLLPEIVIDRVQRSPELLQIAAADADRPVAVPEVEDILSVLVQRPEGSPLIRQAPEPTSPPHFTTNYLEREARNRSLGRAGEQFVINYEMARLIRSDRENLASKVEHTSVIRGDHEGYDILSFEEDGSERLIEVKTTKYGSETPFFITRNELRTSVQRAAQYQLYRLFTFRETPRLYTLGGSIETTCNLSAATFLALPR